MKKVVNFGIMVIISLVFVFMTSLQGFAEGLFFDEQLYICDDLQTGTGDEKEYTISTKGGFFSSSETNTIYLYNENYDEKAKIGFEYTFSGHESFTINGTTLESSGYYSTVIDKGAYLEIVLNPKNSWTTAKLVLKNITYVTLSSSAEITYVFDSTLGTITAGGTAINNGDTITVGADGMEIVATPNSGVRFLGWVDEQNKIIPNSTSYTQFPVGDITLKALFSKNTPYFLLDNTYIFGDLNDAANAGNTIVLMCDGVLPAGDYTIPAEKTLLIPFDDANTLCTTTPLYEQQSSIGKPAAYRTLTLANGANIVVNGAISLGGKQSASIGVHGSPIGTYGHIAMESGSTITVNNGANLYAWGYITGSGTITAKSGATVYEDFQLTDYRGGDATTSMINNSYEVFPMSQYYVQNIEVPLVLEAGAVENGFMSVYVTLAGIQTTHIPFIGPNGMFNILTGYVIKDYDESTDRLVIDVYGELDMKSLSLSMKLAALGGTKTIDSQKYKLPVNGNITININSGSEINISQDIALLPGGEINVYKGGKCTFSSGAEAFIYDSEEWGGYCSQHNYKFKAVNYAPGRKYTRTEADLVDAKVYIEGEVDASAVDAFVYTTKSGADVQGAEGGLVKIKPGSAEITYQVTQNDTDISKYNEIPVTTALLKNADGTYTNPEEDTSCLSSYSYLNGKWVPNHDMSEATCDTPATCTRCGHTEGEALGHDVVTHEAKAPTCDAIGWDAYETCSRCDYSTYVEKSALGHSYGEKWIEADATYHKKVCANDESHVIKEEHTMVDFVCTACGHEKIATNTKYSIADEKITINTTPNFEISNDAQIMIATYNSNGALLNMALRTASTIGEGAEFSSKDVAKIKVFVWAGFDSMKPVSLPEEIAVTANNN